MTTIKTEIRTGAYYDSVILMQLQRALADLPDVLDAGVVMGTDANKELLDQTGLLVDEIKKAKADDLVIVVNGKNAAVAAGQSEDFIEQQHELQSMEKDIIENYSDVSDDVLYVPELGDDYGGW